MLELLGSGLMGDYVCGCDFVLYGVFCVYIVWKRNKTVGFWFYILSFSRGK